MKKLRLYLVKTNKLKRYDPGDDPGSLFLPSRVIRVTTDKEVVRWL